MNLISTKPQRACLYLRTSTVEQHVENQRPALERMAQQRGYKVISIMEEQASAVKKRPVLDQVLKDAHGGKYDVLCVWAIDRLGRSMAGNLQTILDLDRWGVQIVSVQETWLDTSSPVRDLLVAIFSWIASQERARLVERVRLGQDRARLAGVHLGRPKVHVDLARVMSLRTNGSSVREIAKILRTSPSSVHRALLEAEKGVSKVPPGDGCVSA